MSSLGNIILKELKELMTPTTFLPILFIAIIFGSMGNTMGGIEEQLEEKPIIGYINLDDGNFSENAVNILEYTSDVVYNSTDKNQGIEALKEKQGVALIIIKQNFTRNIVNGQSGEIEIYWIMKGGGLLDSISSTVVEELIKQINLNITSNLISDDSNIDVNTTLNPTSINQTTYFKNVEFTGISPNEVSNALSSQSIFIPIVIMMIIIMSGGMVISSMALEKENKTLETLLTLPVKRTSIVAGKIIASAIIGLILSVIYMIGIGYNLSSFQIQSGKSLADYGIALESTDLLLIGLSIFVTLIAALSLCMLLGTMAKNYKSAQTLTFPVTMLALVPMFLTMFKDFNTLPIFVKGFLFAIPFSHPMMAPNALIFDDYLLVISGIIYVSIFALVMIMLAVWVFKTDKLLTGSTGNAFIRMFKKR